MQHSGSRLEKPNCHIIISRVMNPLGRLRGFEARNNVALALRGSSPHVKTEHNLEVGQIPHWLWKFDEKLNESSKSPDRYKCFNLAEIFN